MVHDGLGLQGSHIVVQLACVGLAETPVCVDPAVVIDQDAGVEPELGLHGVGKRSPGLVRLDQHDRLPAVLCGVHIVDAVLIDDVEVDE